MSKYRSAYKLKPKPKGTEYVYYGSFEDQFHFKIKWDENAKRFALYQTYFEGHFTTVEGAKAAARRYWGKGMKWEKEKI